MNIVYATTSTNVAGPSGPVSITWGQHWPADDPVVLAHPSLFSTDPRIGLRVSSPLVEEVEQATAAPGEKRHVRHG